MFSFDYMRLALRYAKFAMMCGDVPVGCVLVLDDLVVVACNEVVASCDPTAHAEILVLRKAARIIQDVRMERADLYVTLEPCSMCAQALAEVRLRRLYFGAYNPSGGGVDHGSRVFDHSRHVPEVYGGILGDEASLLMTGFFSKLR